MILNLGCGDLPIKGCHNVDCFPGQYVDEIVDLNKMPWQWQDNSIDGIYMVHALEHLEKMVDAIKECHRILIKGGFLMIVVPHCSNAGAIGTVGHYRTYSIISLDNFLTGRTYLSAQPLFKRELKRVLYWHTPRGKKHPYIEWMTKPAKTSHPVLSSLCSPAFAIIQKLIDCSPYVFERFWCHYVGGADEIVWKGKKI